MATFRTAAELRAHLERAGIGLPFDDVLEPASRSPLGTPFAADGLSVGNRFAILPMEGWDGDRDGRPSDLTRRRWQRFGTSGAKLIWGGEAVAVRHDGRANPNQLQLNAKTASAIEGLREALVAEHRDRFGSSAFADLVVGLQLTHSGRFAKPDRHDTPAPLSVVEYPVLDRRVPTPPKVLSDDELETLIDDFVKAARLAHLIGFDFVDIKQCHGYLGHELLGARRRTGPYGGSLENRFRFVRTVIQRIRAEVPSLRIGVRLSAVDLVPHVRRDDGAGVPESIDPVSADAGFGVIHGGELDRALEEPMALLRLLEGLGVRWICLTAGSPYYTPHMLRPAAFPPVDGYHPPEDPLAGVARQIQVTARLKAAFPQLAIVGSAYSYLQEWLPHVAQHTIRNGLTDLVGLGRMVLAYPELPADLLADRPLRRAAFCRTFSDCTTGPRMGFVSGCYPLDDFYKHRPEAAPILKSRTELSR
jgi:NADPH2 dehydrogenase